MTQETVMETTNTTDTEAGQDLEALVAEARRLNREGSQEEAEAFYGSLPSRTWLAIDQALWDARICGTCDAPLRVVWHEREGNILVDAEPHPEGIITLDGQGHAVWLRPDRLDPNWPRVRFRPHNTELGTCPGKPWEREGVADGA